MTDSGAFVIVGGGPAALAAARAYREAGATGPVTLVADEERMPYERPPLTKELLRGEADEAELAIEAESWLVDHEVALVGGRAMLLDPGQRELTLAGRRSLRYATCLIATGAEPRRLEIPGTDDPAVRVVRTLDHLRELLARLRNGDRVVVIGSGFIGCEIAASLAMRGHPVTLVSDETGPNRRRLGREASEAIAGWLRELGIELVLDAAAEAIDGGDGGSGDLRHVRAGDRRLTARCVVMAVGVSPRSELLRPWGAIAADNAIPVDAAMRTTVEGVLAAGDVALAHNATAGRSLRVEHWGDALGQGAVAGRTAAGVDAVWDEVPGFWSTIGTRTLKYAAWGDGWDVSSFQASVDGAGFAVHYGRDGRIVGVLSHDLDVAYDDGRELIAQHASWDG